MKGITCQTQLCLGYDSAVALPRLVPKGMQTQLMVVVCRQNLGPTLQLLTVYRSTALHSAHWELLFCVFFCLVMMNIDENTVVLSVGFMSDFCTPVEFLVRFRSWLNKKWDVGRNGLPLHWMFLNWRWFTAKPIHHYHNVSINGSSLKWLDIQTLLQHTITLIIIVL